MREQEPALGGCADALTELARCQHLAGYALLSGQAPAHAAAYADLLALAEQAQDGVRAFVAHKSTRRVDEGKLKALAALLADVR